MRKNSLTESISLVKRLISFAIAFQAGTTAVIGRAICGYGTEPKFNSADLVPIRSVLVVRLDEIGDMVMFSPFLRALRKHLPEAHITLVVKPGVRNLVELCPYTNEVLTFDQRGGRIERFLLLPLRAMLFAVRYLRGRVYDLALLPRWDADYYYAAFVAFWSGAPRRIGYSESVTAYKSVVNRGFDRLLTQTLNEPVLRHDIEHNMAMIRFLGGDADDDYQEVWLGESDRHFAENTLREQGFEPGQKIFGIGPSGGHSVFKQWPLENYAKLGRRLQEKWGAKIILFGGPGEEEMGRVLADGLGPGTLNLMGRTTIRQMAAVMARCNAYVGNDSGPTHIAAASNIPVVAIFGSSCRHRFHPGENTRLVWRELSCGPCQRTNHQEERCHTCIFDQPHCLTEISVDEVLRVVAESISAPAHRLPLTAKSV